MVGVSNLNRVGVRVRVWVGVWVRVRCRVRGNLNSSLAHWELGLFKKFFCSYARNANKMLNSF